jgi:PilZ domain
MVERKQRQKTNFEGMTAALKKHNMSVVLFKRKPAGERRRGWRYMVTTKFVGRELSSSGTSATSKAIIRGQIQNISAGGLRMITNQAIKKFALIRGEVSLHNLPVGVPSIMEVRWTRRLAGGARYELGLRFVL